MSEQDRLTHVRADGSAHMVDVSGKDETTREATAQAVLCTRPDVVALLVAGDLPKGDALAVSRVAGIMAAKATPQLIPLCHPLPLSKVTVDFHPADAGVRIEATVKTRSVTGVEMEALTAAEADFKKKDEDAKKPVADKEAADKALVDAATAKTKADEAKKVADEAATKAAEALVAANKAKDDATKAAVDAATAATAAATKLTQAKEALAKDAENQTLKDAVAAAEKEAADAEAKKKTADEAKVAAEKVATDADTAKKTADTNKVAADKAATDAATAMTQADQKVKQLAPVAQKAVDEKTAAARSQSLSSRLGLPVVRPLADGVGAVFDAIAARLALARKEVR